MITVTIQLFFGLDITVEEAKDIIADHLPLEEGHSFCASYNTQEGTVTLEDLDQDDLTEDQENWLDESPFSAMCIECYSAD